MKVRELADELNVSKMTITRTMKDLGITGVYVGNRVELSDDECLRLKEKILQLPKDEQAQQVQQELQREKQLQQDAQQTQLIAQQTQLIEILREQLSEKDKQIADLNRQIDNLTEMLKVSQERQSELTSALSTAQALHAGTIAQIATTQKPHFWDKLFKKKPASDENDAD